MQISTDMMSDTNENTQNPENPQQQVIYGVLPNQREDEIDLGELFSKLLDQSKLILGLTLGGTILAVFIALSLPNVYQPSITISLPSEGDVASIAGINEFLDNTENDSSSVPQIFSAPQIIFSRFFNLLRSDSVLAEYARENKYLDRLYPDSTEPESVLVADLISALNITIEEPTPGKKDAYVANPTRVSASLAVEDEAAGVALLNGYSYYINQKLIIDLQKDTRETIKNKIEILSKQVSRQREQYRQERMLTIKKVEQENATEIALLEEQIIAYLDKAVANRATEIANAKEALAMANSLDIIYPITLEALAKRGQKGSGSNTAITVLDKQSSSLYLRGSKYLTTLIETLENRKSDAKYLVQINNLREKIHLKKNDQVFAALKKRKSDDPWIKDLPEKLAQIDALKSLTPDFSTLLAYSTDKKAIISNEKIEPKRKLMVVIGFVLSLTIAIFLAIIVVLRKGAQHKSN